MLTRIANLLSETFVATHTSRRDADIVSEYVVNDKVQTIAQVHDVTAGRVSQIVTEFHHKLVTMGEGSIMQDALPPLARLSGHRFAAAALELLVQMRGTAPDVACGLIAEALMCAYVQGHDRSSEVDMVELPLSTRTKAALQAARITEQILLTMTHDELSRVPGMGPKCVYDVQEALANAGMQLKKHHDELSEYRERKQRSES